MELEPLGSLHLTSDQWRRLKTFLHNVEEGNPQNFVTPYFPKEWREKPHEYGRFISEEWGATRYDAINVLEATEADKFGAFSVRLPWSERRDTSEPYWIQKEVTNEKFLIQGFDRIKRWLPRGQLRPISLIEAFDNMPKDTNLGLPLFERSKVHAVQYLRRAISLHKSGYKERLYPAVVGWRGQPGKDPLVPKQRLVWMEDHMETIIGISIQEAVLSALRSRVEFAAWNELDRVDRVITSFIDKAVGNIISIDFSGFDASVPSTVIHYAFELLRYWFVPGATRQIDWLEENLLTVGLVTPDGIMKGRSGGVPSGSALTNLIDSLANLLVVLPFSDVGTVLGDDGVYIPKKSISNDDLSALALDLYGMSISTTKGSESHDEVFYLQRLHLRHYRKNGLCRGVRSITRTWNGICHLERLSAGLPPEFFTCRAIMQIENARWHPNFRNLVRRFYEMDRYVQRMDVEEIFTRAGGVNFVEDKMKITSYRFGRELPTRGLVNFETVRLINEFRSEKSTVA
jgi:hypothetical protein